MCKWMSLLTELYPPQETGNYHGGWGWQSRGKGMPLAGMTTWAFVGDSGCLAQHQALWGWPPGSTRMMAKMGREVARTEAKQRPYSTHIPNKLSENTGEEELTLTKCWIHYHPNRNAEVGTSSRSSSEGNAVDQSQDRGDSPNKSDKFLLTWILDAKNWWVSSWWVMRLRVWRELFDFTEPWETLEIIHVQKLSNCLIRPPAAGAKRPVRFCSSWILSFTLSS